MRTWHLLPAIAMALAICAPNTHAQNEPLFVLKWGGPPGGGSADGEMDLPRGIAIDAVGNVYIADSFNQRIQKFDSSGNFIRKWGSPGSGDGQFSLPTSVAVDAYANVYVGDRQANRIQKFDSTGTFITKWGGPGAGTGQFLNVVDVAVGSDGSVYAVDDGNRRIQKFDGDGNFLLQWGSMGTGDGEFDLPKSIAIDADENVFIGDVNSQRIQKFDSLGTFITKWGSFGSGPGEFFGPYGLAADASGRVYVADRFNDRVQIFEGDGTFLVAFGTDGPGDGQFRDVVDLEMRSTSLYTVDENMNQNRVTKFGLLEPLILDIEDVGNDQGRSVRIRVGPSIRDSVGPPSPILQYEVFRRIDALPGVSRAPSAAIESRSDPTVLTQGWEFVGSIPAHVESEYNVIVPTLADSSDGGIHWSVFFVRAATASPGQYFDSPVDSGYSIDNLAPLPPQALAVTYAPEGNHLTWEENEEPDLRGYRVYRGLSQDFDVGEGTPIGEVGGSSFLDAPPPLTAFYKITAVDQVGNESQASAPAVPTSSELPHAPLVHALHVPVPNPSGVSSNIRYDMPQAGHVEVSVYDLGGRLVRTLVDDVVAAGRWSVRWNGMDLAGRPVPPGIYLVGMVSGPYHHAVRLVLAR